MIVLNCTRFVRILVLILVNQQDFSGRLKFTDYSSHSQSAKKSGIIVDITRNKLFTIAPFYCIFMLGGIYASS